MKKLNFCIRLFIFASLALSICHPSLQLSAAQALPEKETSGSCFYAGGFKNGVAYTFIPSDQLKGGVWVKLTCSITDSEDKEQVSMLTQHALFYGTEDFNRVELAKKLNDLGLDVDADSYLQSNGSEQSLQISLSNDSPEKLREALSLLNQLAFHPTLTNRDIELARNHVLAANEQSDEEALPFQSVTATELQEFHAKWYRPENMHLTIIGIANSKDILPLVAASFGTAVDTCEEILIPAPVELPSAEEMESHWVDALSEKVEWTTDNQSLVVDGKIWMKEPNWINKSSNGKTLGTVLTALGLIGGGLVAALVPGALPIAIVAGFLTSGTGLYFVSSDYLKDPHYIEAIRKTDLQKGCAYVYKQGRAGFTLTPYERRASFLQEMVDAKNLSKRPILLLADLYQLNDPVIAGIFTVDEFNVVSHLKSDFVQQRNTYKLIKENLERELAVITAPYALARDSSLLLAQDNYHQNYYVVTKASLKVQRDANIEAIKEGYAKNEITLNEKETLIQETYDYYDAVFAQPDFKTGLNYAEMNLAQAEQEIINIYDYQIEVAKQSIQYYQRMEYYNNGEIALVNYYDQELHNLLVGFPIYYTIFQDFIDLRDL